MNIFSKKDNNDSKQDNNEPKQGNKSHKEEENDLKKGQESEKDLKKDEDLMEAKGSETENPPSMKEPNQTKKNSEATCMEENKLLKEQLFRLAADFDNFKKRTARQMEENRKAVLENMLLDFVEVTDNFERALKSAKTAEDMDSIINGIEQLSKQFYSLLQKYGLEKIECGKASEFDPHKHEAIQHVETSEVPENTVVEVYKPGYVLNSRVIRPAMVSVAKSPELSASKNPDKE
jgi:molecular chaperone GrpE